VLPRLEDKMRAVQVARDVETTVSAYLATVTLINAGLGVAVGLAMWLLGVPNPALWGALAAVFNFIPYLGSIVMAGILTIVSAGTFSDVGQIFLTPAVFLTLTSLEGYLVTPTILGRRLALNHVAIFVSIIFWGWLWGVAGALLAAPLVAVASIIGERIPSLNPLAEFLSD